MKSIFLVNSFSGQGHLDSYARLYTRALLELGYRVTLVAATDGGTSDYLARNKIDQSPFSFVPFSQPDTEAVVASRSHLSAIQRAQLVWKEERAIGLLRRLIVVPRRFARRLVPEPARIGWRKLKQATNTRLAQIPAVRALRQFLFPDAGRILFISLIRHVQNAVSVLGNKRPDLVFFLYLDMMAEGPANITALDTIGRWPWAGIQFHPRLRESPEARIEQYFESSTAKGGLFLVPDAVDIYAKVAPRLKFLLVPDVADLELAAELPSVAKQIQSRAAGRTIVLLVGTIAPHKGVMMLLDVVAKADPQRFFFALVGEVYWHGFGNDVGQLRNFYAQAPENVVVHDGYVADERDYNSLVAACDIVYAVYSGFNSSSNSLTKAAGLKRPILTAKNSLMGERVLAHGIGLAVTSNDANEILAGLEHLRTSKDDDFRFNSYAGQHSLDALKSIMAEALPPWIAGSGASDGV
jgi:glycosyltransferase involved in cell wall biosynthesis